MKKALLILSALGAFLVPSAVAQSYSFFASTPGSRITPQQFLAGKAPAINLIENAPILEPPAALPRMAPDLALAAYFDRAQRQVNELGAYEDLTVIEASLPSSRQHGRFELRRTFNAPKSLAFKAIGFVGDSFVKSNVITRLLQSEVEHVEKGKGAETAITADNYKFKFKGNDQIDGASVYAYEVKPRKKRPGLFKGRIYVDPYTGGLRRAEGQIVKSPSFFIKKIEFVQDYAEIDGFSLPVRLHSVTRARLIGEAIVDIFHSDYQARSLSQLPVTRAALSGSGSN